MRKSERKTPRKKSKEDAEARGPEHSLEAVSTFPYSVYPFVEAIQADPGYAQAILTAIPDLLFVVSTQGIFLSGHARDQNELLIPQNTFQGKSAHHILPKDVADLLLAAISRIVQGEQLVNFSYSLFMQGAERIFDARITPLNHDRVVVVVRDVTKRELALRQLERSADLLEQVGEMALIGAVSFDVETGLLSFSEVAAKLFQIAGSSDLSLVSFLETLPSFDEREKLSKLFQTLISDGGEIDDICYLTLADLSKVWIRWNMRAEKRNEKVERLYGSIQDISHQKQSEARIEHMLNAVQQQNRRLINFAQIVSHNLKSHATNLTALTEMLKHEEESVAESQTFAYLEQATRSLNQTVAHLAEVARINMFDADHGKSLNLHDAVDKTFENVRALALKSEVELINEVPEKIYVVAYEEYLDSIVLNLISNAIRYRSTERSSFVRASARVEHNEVQLRIEDNGLGIDLELHGDHLFEMYKTFHQHPDSRGIGLFITKSQIEFTGGRITVESKPNIGSVFTIFWPMK